jgi:NAD(P)-dependent dehydrogenase (short-subunit alcohol dehydrogenase family)
MSEQANVDPGLQGKVALVTGGASGIGRATALLLAAEGAAVAVVDLDERGARAVARQASDAGGRAIAVECDVSDSPQAKATVERVVSAFGRLDILFNNAGIIHHASVTDTTEEDWDRVMSVNVRSIFLMCKHAVPLMIRAGGGAIVNTASDWGLVGGPRTAAYCASKGAVVQLTRALAIDHGPQGIRVNCVCPGDTDTPLLRTEAAQLGRAIEDLVAEGKRVPLGRIGTPEEIARIVLFLASDAASFVTGSALPADGGALAGF